MTFLEQAPNNSMRLQVLTRFVLIQDFDALVTDH